MDKKRGERIKIRREKEGLSIRELSDKSGVDWLKIKAIEDGKIDLDENIASKISTPLNTLTRWLLYGEEWQQERKESQGNHPGNISTAISGLIITIISIFIMSVLVMAPQAPIFSEFIGLFMVCDLALFGYGIYLIFRQR